MGTPGSVVLGWIVILFPGLVFTDDIHVYEFTRNISASFPGWRLEGHGFEHFSTKRQVIHCAYECLKSSRCRSFNYQPESWACELNDGDHAEFSDDFQKQPNDSVAEYHQRDAFDIAQEALGPCARDPCQNAGRCLDTVNSRMERVYYCLCTEGWAGENCEIEAHRIDWGEWEDWGTCSVSCETGWTSRRRNCIDTVTMETLSAGRCYGKDVEFKSCRLQQCPRWLSWAGWGDCSTQNTCGRGVMTRHRNCSHGGTPGIDRYCLGFSNQSAPCNGIDCRGLLLLKDVELHGEGRIEIFNDLDLVEMDVCADQGWDMTAVDIACKQMGFETAAYEVDNMTYTDVKSLAAPPYVIVTCAGTERTLQQCARQAVTSCESFAGITCRVRGGWSLWSSWGDCSVTCENGTRRRSRDCVHPPPNFGGTPCPGDEEQFKPCTEKMCPSPNIWGEWEAWSGCDVTCGEGERMRSRECLSSTLPCVGTNVSYDICPAEVVCPVDGVWNTWAAWSDCSVTCANGTRFRTRTCDGPYYDGAECGGPDEDIEDCFPRMCEVDGVWLSWAPWSECSHTCGYGNRNRSRECEGPYYGGLECPESASDVETCNAFSCPVDGAWKNWEDWAECSVSCGGGIRNRTRDCDDPLHGGADCPGPSEQSEACNEHPCPIDGVFSEWVDWSECSVTCANGTQWRNRTCFGPYFGGANCTGPYYDEQICVTAKCPVDGVWADWQGWQECNVTCGGGTQLRVRTCTGPFYGGLECPGSSEDRTECNTHPCPIDGNWDDWSSWITCPVTCNGGTQFRNRTCTQPLLGGAECPGQAREERECGTDPCPVDGEWKGWTGWSECTLPCGGGNKTRTRECHAPENGGATCSGLPKQTVYCNSKPCTVDGVWETWSNWTECSLTCGTGSRTRNRTCTGPFFGGAECPGPANETDTCNDFPCPIDGAYSDWTPWSACSQTCGRGTTDRNRTCFGPFFGGSPCEGVNFEQNYCYPSNCPVNGLWDPWSPWTDCSTTCENGTRTRDRVCDGPFFGGLNCSGAEDETEDCFLRWCPVDGVWTTWTDWDECPVTCAGSLRNRTRECEGPFHDGAECEGEASETEDCGTNPCPVDGAWSLWTKWGACNVSCGGGTSDRSRFCSDTQHGGSNCTGPAEEYKDCNTHECPIDGVWTDWVDWSECTHSCGTGERYRSRNCTGPFYGGAECDGDRNETEHCNTHECPIPGFWGTWKVWTHCSESCEGGQQLRVRTCLSWVPGSEQCEGPSQETRSCNMQACPIDGVWITWAPWTTCNVTCGGGHSWRSRNCTGPFFGGAECPGDDFENRTCNTHECPIDGVWEDWTVWDACSVTCGGGNQSRYRNCTGPFYGGAECPGPSNETQDCNSFECPIDGALTEWSEFYTCDVTCGGGIQWRNRTCIGPFFGGANCSDPLENSRDCNMHECPIDGVYIPWSTWGQCDITCGGGIQWRNRTCDGPYYGGAECDGPDVDNRTCNDFPCPIDGVWLTWTDWDICSVTCGGGNQSRYRECEGPFHEGLDCQGPDVETRDCNTHHCPVDGVFVDWSTWYTCNVTCGGGIQWRNRTCDGPFYDGADCDGAFNDSQECNTQECPIDGVYIEWSLWYDCSVTCGGGTRMRNRTCTGPFYGGADCDGPPTETEICGTDPCPIPGDWFPWTPWSPCTVTCGGGVRNRSRTCDWESYGELTAECEGDPEEIDDCHTFDCTPLSKTCAEWSSKGLNQSCIADIDPDGDDSMFSPVKVECDFDSEPGKALTVIHHDHENRTRVKGYEGAGEYVVELTYDVGWAQAIRIIDNSAACVQYMLWECLAAIIHNPFNTNSLTTFWKNRTEQIPNYFGGATPGSGNCACGETHTCANASLPCNCDDNNADIWLSDGGYVTNKDELPVHSFYAGDTAAI